MPKSAHFSLFILNTRSATEFCNSAVPGDDVEHEDEGGGGREEGVEHGDGVGVLAKHVGHAADVSLPGGVHGEREDGGDSGGEHSCCHQV